MIALDSKFLTGNHNTELVPVKEVLDLASGGNMLVARFPRRPGLPTRSRDSTSGVLEVADVQQLSRRKELLLSSSCEGIGHRRN